MVLIASGMLSEAADDDDHAPRNDHRVTLLDGDHLRVVKLSTVHGMTPEDGDLKRPVTWRPNFRFIDTASVTPDPETSAKIEELNSQLSAELDVEIGSTSVAISSKRAVVRGEESAMGNLIADATRAKNGADVSITNGGGIRGDTEYPAGHVFTRKDIFTELPFGNVTTVTEITGADPSASVDARGGPIGLQVP